MTQSSHFWGEQRRKYKAKLPHFEQIIKGKTLDQIFNNHFKNQLVIQAVIRQDLNEFEQNMRYEYVAGVGAFIRELRDKGVKTAIVTSSNQLKMDQVYRSHPELHDLFDLILTAGMFAESKPAPDCYLMGAKTFETLPENCFVFEDSFHGLESGNRANMRVIGLATTNSAESIREKSNLVIADFTGFTYQKMMEIAY